MHLVPFNIIYIAVPPMVQAAKGVAISIGDPMAASKWREQNNDVSMSDVFINKYN